MHAHISIQTMNGSLNMKRKERHYSNDLIINPPMPAYVQYSQS